MTTDGIDGYLQRATRKWRTHGRTIVYNERPNKERRHKTRFADIELVRYSERTEEKVSERIK